MYMKKKLAKMIIYILTSIITVVWCLALLEIVKPIMLIIISVICTKEIIDLAEFLND